MPFVRALSLCVVVAAGLASPAGATVLWERTTLPGMGTCPNGNISMVSDPVQGQVIKVQVAEVDTSVSNSERCEFVMSNNGEALYSAGATLYIGWKSRVVTPVTSTWNGIYQAKCHGSHVADQPLVWSVANGQLRLENHEDIGGQEVSRTVYSRSLPMDTWFSITMKIHFSESRTAGYVQVWYNGVLQTLANGSTIHFGQTWDGSENNMHWGIYRRSSVNGTEIHYVWRPRLATTFAEANPGGGTVTPTPTPTPTATTPPRPTPTPTPTPTACASCPGVVEVTPPASGVTASTHDGNLPGNTVDNNLGTRWSANGDGQWIRYDLGSTQTVGYVAIAVHNGNSRQNRFDLQVSSDGVNWTNVRTGVLSSGTTTNEETHDFPDVAARYVRYMGHSATTSTFNSLSEVSIFASTAPAATPTPTATPTSAATPTPTPTTPPGGPVEITPGAAGVSASTHDGNLPGNTVDGSLTTRWSANGDGQWIQYDLGATRTTSSVKIAWYSGNLRRSTFDVLASDVASGPWTTLVAGRQSSGATTALEEYDVADGAGRYVRVVGHGNTVNLWNSISEVEIWGN